MRVGVGSRNPVKRAATERALSAAYETATVETVGVDSGVSEQPTGEAETVEGAENRARNALGGRNLGVGVEGGVADGPDGCYLIMWAAVTDGERLGRGAGPRLRLPDAIAERIHAGEELGPIMDDVIGESDVARGRGAAGVLTGGIIDRQDALRHAVAGALGPFVTDLYAGADRRP